ncbi:MAG: serine hydrolase [Saccharofermentans sp.]|nr:serine hydrolase [Clostridiales bacterium]MCR4767918.1 serine hydrolase [Saccharofermentans sp.]
MKRPNPTFLKKAEGIKTHRKKRTLIIILVLLVITFVVVFISSIASAQDTYRLMFPDLVGAATSTTTSYSEYQRPVHTTTETTTEVTTTATTTELHAVLAATATPTPEPTPVTVQDNSPEPFMEYYNFSFKPVGVQRATYQERAVYMDELKEKITSYQKSHPNMRICYDFISLPSGEHLGVDELEPVVPSGAMAIPFSIVYYDKIAGITGPLSEIVTFDQDYKGSRTSSYIAKNYSYGKQFYMRTILHYAVAKNDSIALNYLIEKLGGIDEAVAAVNGISGYIPYNEDRIYKDYRGKEFRVSRTTSCYDMGNYISYLYHVYINDPQINQRLINDLADNEVESPLSAAFPSYAKILHVLGRNTDRNAYLECAIVDYKEPIALVIYVEAATPEAAGTAIATLGGYTQKYIEACYEF